MNIITVLTINILIIAALANVQVYNDWKTCADFECFDEFNECSNSSREFYSAACANEVTAYQTCIVSCTDQTCLTNCGLSLTQPIAIGYMNC